jgi:hypothetical protein
MREEATAILIDKCVSRGGRWSPPGWDITSFVGKLLEVDDVDLLREGVGMLAQALTETEERSSSILFQFMR